jgi:4'-phosphopantetheinyl transferase
MASALLSPESPRARLAEREVHVWSALLDRPPDVVETLRRLLSRDELARAARFHFERDRSRFAVGRASLRLLLGRYLAEPPGSIRFSYSSHGKPALLPPHDTISFNLSHSEGLALYAVCRGHEIGIDVEQIRREPARERVPEHFFSAGEVETLRALRPQAQAEAFLSCWTRKEAFVKARGDGLTLPLDSFDVSLAPGDEPRLLRTAWDPAEAASWSLHDLSPSFPGYVASVAVRGAGWSMHVHPAPGGRS